MLSIWKKLKFCRLVKGYESPVTLNTIPLPNDKILEKSKLKAVADSNLKVIQMAKFVLKKIENIVEKEENTGYQHFLVFPQCF